MLKKICVVFLILILLCGFCYGTEEIFEETKKAFGIKEFTEEAENYTKDALPEIDIGELVTSGLKGDIDLSFFQKVISVAIGDEMIIAIRLMVTVLIVIVINSICKAILENLGNEETTKIVYVLQYLMVVILVSTSLVSILKITGEAIDKLVNFMNLLVPLFTTLVLSTGSIATTNMAQPILLFLINFIGNFSNNFLIPLLLISCVLSIISNISERVQITGIAKFLRSSIVWCLGIILTVFTSVISLEGTLSASVDGLTAKTTKAAVTNFIPVIGKILGDATETVLGCANILKNTVGFVGVIIILGIVILPIIKIAIFTVCFKLTSSVGAIVADSKIVKLISEIADTYKILLAILFAVSIMFIIGITLVLKISNSSIMYR